MPALDVARQQMEEEARRLALMEMADGMEVSPVPSDASAEAPAGLADLAPASSREMVARGAPQSPEAEADPYGDALAEASRRRFSHTGSNFARGIIKAFTGVSDDSGQADRAAFEQAPVVEFLQRQQMADKKRAADLSAQKALPKAGTAPPSPDPDSPESRHAQEVYSYTYPNRYTPEQLAKFSAADFQRLKLADKSPQMEGIESGRESEVGRDKRAQADRLQRAQQFAAREGRAWAQMSQAERLAAMRATEKDETQAASQETGLRKEFMGSPVVREYQQAQIGLDKVERAAADPSAAGDLALIFGYMKTLDPTSAVKETEFANAENAKGIPDAVRAKWNKALSGERLTPAQRKEFIASARTQFKAYESAYMKQKSYYDGLAPPGSEGRVTFPGGGLDLDAPSPTPRVEAPARSTAPPESIREKIDLPDGSQLITYTNGRQVKRTPKKKE